MNKPSSPLSEWLERLQQESWNLELLISGFSIFLLLEATDIISDSISYINNNTHLDEALHMLAITILGILFMGVSALIVNLILHIFLRGIWIGAIGLRSVQQDIDYKKLNYSNFFTRKLQVRVKSLDKMIIQLDTVCSVIFSFTFLVFFMFLSFALFFCVMIFFIQIAKFFIDMTDGYFQKIIKTLLLICSLFYSIFGLFYFIDTLTMGFFKKYHRLSKLYYPFYRFFNFVTFSSVYQSIYYTLLSRFSKGRLTLVLGLYLFIVFNAPLFSFNQYTFFPDRLTEVNFNSRVYDNLRNEEAVVKTASIANDVVNSRFLPVFIAYNVRHNDAIRHLCTEYEPSKKSPFISGISFDKGFQINDPIVVEENPAALLQCLSQAYEVYVNDSLYAKQEYFFYQHPNYFEKGLRTMLDTEGLPKGKNVIRIMRKDLNEAEEIEVVEYAVIPFWLE